MDGCTYVTVMLWDTRVISGVMHKNIITNYVFITSWFTLKLEINTIMANILWMKYYCILHFAFHIAVPLEYLGMRWSWTRKLLLGSWYHCSLECMNLWGHQWKHFYLCCVKLCYLERLIATCSFALFFNYSSMWFKITKFKDKHDMWWCQGRAIGCACSLRYSYSEQVL